MPTCVLPEVYSVHWQSEILNYDHKLSSMHSTPVRSPYLGANFAYVVRPIPAGPGQTLPGGCFRCRNAHNKFSATRFAHFFLIEVPEVGPGFAT